MVHTMQQNQVRRSSAGALSAIRGFFAAFACAAAVSLPGQAPAQESHCYGTSENGRLEGGVQLPSSGPNFVSYGSVPEAAGRTYVHSLVRSIVVEAYQRVAREQPQKVFKFAETGFRSGGRFPPHKTHRNGTSVDFMVPVVDAHGTSVHLPTTASNSFGYDIELDSEGRYGELRLDFEALAAHLAALNEAAKAAGVSIRRVIFDPALVPQLYQTSRGSYLKKELTISKKKSWVRHDEHYHVDFTLRCRPL